MWQNMMMTVNMSPSIILTQIDFRINEAQQQPIGQLDLDTFGPIYSRCSEMTTKSNEQDGYGIASIKADERK